MRGLKPTFYNCYGNTRHVFGEGVYRYVKKHTSVDLQK